MERGMGMESSMTHGLLEIGATNSGEGDIKDLTNQLAICHDESRKEGCVIGVPEYDLILAVVSLAARDAVAGDYQAEVWLRENVIESAVSNG
uniref:Uncharacterized protein n=1 Tax=viral metagenome TaxID=1070528 RepID=A0A6M3K9F3_9ZZZZ